LKPENLLLTSKDPKASVKLADFGLSKIMEASAVMKTACGTPGYVAPEVLMGSGYDNAVDVWSLGVIMYILLVGFPPFYAENNAKLFDKIMAGKFSFPSPYWDSISTEAKDLIKKMLVVDPTKRISTQDIVNHIWIKGLVTSNTDLMGSLRELEKTTQNTKKRLLFDKCSSI